MTLRGDNCRWQQLMDGPYDRWQKHCKELDQLRRADKISAIAHNKRRWSFKGMLNNGCYNQAERVACVLGKLNQQVDNGGFSQWVSNGYAVKSWDWLPDILEEMGPASKKVLDLCCQMMAHVDEDEGDFEIGDDWENTIMPLSDTLSDAFYALHDEWHPEVYAYLEKLEK